MKYLAIIIGLFTAPSWANNCAIAESPLMASYQLTSSAGKNNKFQLWRKTDRVVAHQYPKNQIVEVWQKLSNNLVRPIRYFEQYQRGIEYQPNELKKHSKTINWQKKQQLISEKTLKSMTLVSSEGAGCNVQQHYQLKQKNQQLNVTWLPALKLVKRIQFIKGEFKRTTTLQSYSHDKNKISAQFAKWENYQTTDYADIGDNEHDPFLAKMINQGFIEHGATGFYNSQGEVIKGEHHHH